MKRIIFLIIILANMCCQGKDEVVLTEPDLIGKWEVVSIDGDTSVLGSSLFSVGKGWVWEFHKKGITIGPSKKYYTGYLITNNNLLSILNSKGIAFRFEITDFDNETMSLRNYEYNSLKIHFKRYYGRI